MLIRTNHKKYFIHKINYTLLWLSYYYNLSLAFFNIQSLNAFKNVSINLKKGLAAHPSLIKSKLPLNTSERQSLQQTNSANILFLFKIFINLNLNPYSTYMRPHAIFNIMFMDHSGHGSVTLNLKRAFMRWRGMYSLLYNVFYYNNELLIFGHKFFKTDILALNTLNGVSLKAFFKYSSVFYYLKESSYGSTNDRLIHVLKNFKIQTAFISDLTNHEKTSVNLRKCRIYTIGIIGFGSNPWVLSYPLPIQSNGLFAQYYFIRYLYHIQQQAISSRYEQLRLFWKRF